MNLVLCFTNHAIDWICSVKVYCCDKCSVKVINVNKNEQTYNKCFTVVINVDKNDVQ